MVAESVLDNPGCGGCPDKYAKMTQKAAERLKTPVPEGVRHFIASRSALCEPDDIRICDGSESENTEMIKLLQDQGVFTPLPKYKNCWLALSDPKDVARVEGKTVICTDKCEDTVPAPKSGFGPSKEASLPNLKCTQIGNWMSRDEGRQELLKRFPGCMKGRTMYVIPFCMGPLGSNMSKYGVEITDSAYVVVCMRIMTRMTEKVLYFIEETGGDFVRCLHSVGVPLPAKDPIVNNWPCNPAKTIVSHFPQTAEIISFGSGYGGNALCGKKCFALRIGSILARDQGWLAEHMLILGLTNPEGVKKYVVAAFPSACGKTNLAMLTPTIPGYKVETVGDDIAWMRFNKDGRLVAINPEYGFFGVAPGTSFHSNPNAMKTIFENTIFTNVARTDDGGVYWEDMDSDLWKGKKITSWKNKEWKEGDAEPGAHPNSRFCSPAGQCPVIDKEWENPEGVPIDAIIFGGRRPAGVPLVYESFDWNHGVFMGACVKSEATAAAEHTAKVVMHDPFAMRPFFGYNFGNYIKHWLSFSKKADLKLPKVFHVNWFRRDSENKFLWPGYGDNSRVLEWICKRCNGDDVAIKTAVGYVPKKESLNMTGLEGVNLEELLSVPTDFWKKEVTELRAYFEEHVNQDLPEEIKSQLDNLEKRVNEA